MSGVTALPTPLPVVRPAQMDKTAPEHQWLIESLWSAQAVGWIGGSPKSCKSWLGLEMAISVATGRPCLDHFAVHQTGTVLVYLAEDSLPNIRQRLESLCLHKGLCLDELDICVIDVPTLRLDHRADVRRLEATIRHHQPRLVVLDPLVRLHKSDENNAQDVASLLADLRDLQRRYYLAIAVVHHTRKAVGGVQLGQTLRGSGDLHAWSDSAIYLVRRRNGLKLVVEHRSAPQPRPVSLRLIAPPAHLEIVEPDDEQAPPPLDQRVVELLRKAPGPMRRKDVRGVLGVNSKRLGDALLYLEKLGRIRRTPSGWVAA